MLILLSAVKLLLALGIASTLLCVTIARADPSPRLFVGNFIGNDATVENYLSISGGARSRCRTPSPSYLEKAISPESSFSLFGRLPAPRAGRRGRESQRMEQSRSRLQAPLLPLPATNSVPTLIPTSSCRLATAMSAEISYSRRRRSCSLKRVRRPARFARGCCGPRPSRATCGFDSKVTGARDDLLECRPRARILTRLSRRECRDQSRASRASRLHAASRLRLRAIPERS